MTNYRKFLSTARNFHVCWRAVKSQLRTPPLRLDIAVFSGDGQNKKKISRATPPGFNAIHSRLRHVWKPQERIVGGPSPM